MSNAKKKIPAEPQEPMAYIGPNIKNIVFKGTVFEGGIPEPLKDKISKIPALKGMLVPVSNLAAAGAEIARQGTTLNNLYQAVNLKLGENNE